MIHEIGVIIKLIPTVMRSAIIFLLLATANLIIAQSTISIPDRNFEWALIDLGYDKTGPEPDGYMTDELVHMITYLFIPYWEGYPDLPSMEGKITDLTGIEYFYNLVKLPLSYSERILISVH